MLTYQTNYKTYPLNIVFKVMNVNLRKITCFALLYRFNKHSNFFDENIFFKENK